MGRRTFIRRHIMQIALFQPDIPQNTGTILRLCACLDVAAHIIEPAGFPVSDRHFRRAGMDYLDQVSIIRHDSWSKFEQWRNDGGFRLILFTTKTAGSYLDYRYGADDVLLFGRESAGVPDAVAASADARLLIPIKPGLRSLNVADGRGHGPGRGAQANRFRTFKEAIGELRGQRDFSDPAGRRRPCRPGRGVLPILRLQSLERPRTGPRQRNLPVL